MLLATLTACALGLAAGVRHALEPDHVAAVSTLLADGKPARASVRWATAWGAGHGVMLVACAAPLAIAGASLPPRASNAFEIVVACMLVALGVRALVVTRQHGTTTVRTRLPFAVGVVHGLAGSGALAALAGAELRSAPAAIAFVTIYAVGALCGMAALAGLLGAPLGRLGRAPRGRRVVSAIAALFSVGLGVAYLVSAA